MGTLVLAGATSGSTTLTPVDAVTTVLTLPSSTATLATLGANTFTGNQAVTGALTVSTTLVVTGNAAVGTTILTPFSTGRQLQVGAGGVLYGHATDERFAVLSNAYEKVTTGNWTYITTKEAVNLSMDNGALSLQTAPSGTADTTVTWTERFAVGNTGAVTMPTQPAFLVKAANQLDRTGDGTAYTMTWTTEIFDQGNNFASSTFTAPVTGKYRFSYGLSVEGVLSTHTSSSTQLVTSNRNILFQVANVYNIYDATNGISWLGGSTLTDMDAGDTATVSVTVSNGTKVIDLGDNSHFSGELVC